MRIDASPPLPQFPHLLHTKFQSTNSPINNISTATTMNILLSTFLLAVIATVSANPDAALHNQHDKHNDDLYQSLVFSHYLNKQGVVGGNGWGPDNEFYTSKDTNRKREVAPSPTTRGPYHYVTTPAPSYDEPEPHGQPGFQYPYSAPHYPYQYEPPLNAAGYGVTPKPALPYAPVTPAYPQTPANPAALKSLAPYHHHAPPPAAPYAPPAAYPNQYSPDFGYNYNQPYNQFFDGEPFPPSHHDAAFPGHGFHHPIPHTPTRKPIRFESEPHHAPLAPVHHAPIPAEPHHEIAHHTPAPKAATASPKPFVHLGSGYHPQSAMFHHEGPAHPVHHAVTTAAPLVHHNFGTPSGAIHHAEVAPHHVSPAPHHVSPVPHHVTPAPHFFAPIHHAVTPTPEPHHAAPVTPAAAIFHHAVSPVAVAASPVPHPDVDFVHHNLGPQQHAALVKPTTPAPLHHLDPQSFIFTPAPVHDRPQQPFGFAVSPQPEQPAAFAVTPTPPPQSPVRSTIQPQVEAVRSSGVHHATPVPIFAIPGALPASVTAAPFQLNRNPTAAPFQLGGQPTPAPFQLGGQPTPAPFQLRQPPPLAPSLPTPPSKQAAPIGNRIPQDVSTIYIIY